ncbi:MAG: GTP-binding protein, partial [Enhydrobacter sp.]
PEPVDRAALLEVLHDAAVLRGKGIVRFRDSPDRRSVVHQVGKRIDITDTGPWSDTEESQLVLLGVRPVLGSL